MHFSLYFFMYFSLFFFHAFSVAFSIYFSLIKHVKFQLIYPMKFIQICTHSVPPFHALFVIFSCIIHCILSHIFHCFFHTFFVVILSANTNYTTLHDIGDSTLHTNPGSLNPFVMCQVLGHQEYGKPVPTGHVVVQVGCQEEKGVW